MLGHLQRSCAVVALPMKQAFKLATPSTFLVFVLCFFWVVMMVWCPLFDCVYYFSVTFAG